MKRFRILTGCGRSWFCDVSCVSRTRDTNFGNPNPIPYSTSDTLSSSDPNEMILTSQTLILRKHKLDKERITNQTERTLMQISRSGTIGVADSLFVIYNRAKSFNDGVPELADLVTISRGDQNLESTRVGSIQLSTPNIRCFCQCMQATRQRGQTGAAPVCGARLVFGFSRLQQPVTKTNRSLRIHFIYTVSPMS
jgi:hypothetical protein